MGKKRIQTSVDKLVELVNEKERISFREAAKKLAIPVSSVEEWAHFLEEEDILTIDYHLMTPYLVKKQLTAQQKQRRIESFTKERSIFDKKIEAAQSYFNELDKKITSVSELFEDIEGNLSKKLKDVEQEIATLAKVEAQKERLDDQILEAKERSLKKIKELEGHLEEEKISYKRAFESTKKELEQDERLIQQSESTLEKVKEQEQLLEKKLEEVRNISKEIQQQIDDRAKKVSEAEGHMHDVRKRHEELKEDLVKEQKSLQEMIKENEEQEAMIRKLQKSIFDQMTEEEAQLTAKEKEIRDLPEKFKSMLERRNEIKDLLNVINHEELELKDHIETLGRRARTLKLSLGSKEFEEEMARMTKEIESVTQQRTFFQKKIEQLINLLDWRNGKKEEKRPQAKAEGSTETSASKPKKGSGASKQKQASNKAKPQSNKKGKQRAGKSNKR